MPSLCYIRLFCLYIFSLLQYAPPLRTALCFEVQQYFCCLFLSSNGSLRACRMPLHKKWCNFLRQESQSLPISRLRSSFCSWYVDRRPMCLKLVTRHPSPTSNTQQSFKKPCQDKANLSKSRLATRLLGPKRVFLSFSFLPQVALERPCKQKHKLPLQNWLQSGISTASNCQGFIKAYSYSQIFQFPGFYSQPFDFIDKGQITADKTTKYLQYWDTLHFTTYFTVQERLLIKTVRLLALSELKTL